MLDLLSASLDLGRLGKALGYHFKSLPERDQSAARKKRAHASFLEQGRELWRERTKVRARDEGGGAEQTEVGRAGVYLVGLGWAWCSMCGRGLCQWAGQSVWVRALTTLCRTVSVKLNF